uniref:BPI2 domain-containing protein n=1 Tax=Steinernema glaseri TaxID=37863 RepID=A0A1I8AFI1_9BILA
MVMARKHVLLVLFYVCSLHLCSGRTLLQNSRWNTEYGYPGVKIRLTKKGADHVKDVGVKLLNEEIAGLRGLRVQHALSQPGLEGKIEVEDITVLNFKPATYSDINFLPPSFIVLGLENLDITLTGRFLGTTPLFTVPGIVHGDIRQMTIALTTNFHTTQEGLMAVNVVNCSTVIGYSQFTLNPEGPLSAIVKTFELQINEIIRQRIPALFCNSLREIIEKNSPKLFQRLSRTYLSDHFKKFDGSTVIDRFIRKFTQGLYLDNVNIFDPVITNNYFETQQLGEVRYNESTDRAPFFPKYMNTSQDSDRMLYLYGSEYIFNSLLYHAYQTDRLSLKLEEANLPDKYKGFVRTSCNENAGKDGDFVSGICVGKLIPSIEQHFPNTTTSFHLLPHDLPEFRFADGVGSMDVSTRILTNVKVNGSWTQILVSSASGQTDIKLMAENGKFSGDLKLKKLNVRLHRSAIEGIDPESIEQLAPLAKTFLGPQLAKGLKQGFPYPLQDSITFIEPDLSIHEGYVQLATDFILGETKLREKVRQAFENIKRGAF